MKKNVFYHAGCPVCLSAEHDILSFIPLADLEIIHLGDDKSKILEAERLGVKSVPALIIPNGNVLHINFGADIKDLK